MTKADNNQPPEWASLIPVLGARMACSPGCGTHRGKDRNWDAEGKTMGRPERPLDPESGPLQRFAYDLRRLRLDAGSPSYRELARKTQYSTSVLSRAASGRELPSLAVALAYASACGGDTKHWQARWEALARQSQLATEVPGAAADRGPTQLPTKLPGALAEQRPAQSASLRSRGAVMAAWALTMVAALVTGRMIAGANSKGPLPSGNSASAVAAASPTVHDGADPQDVGCTTPAVTIAAAPIRAAEQVTASGQVFEPGTVLGTVELRYSARCRAAWARVIPVPAFDHPMSGREIVGDTRPTDHQGSTWSPGDVQRAYSDMLFTSGGCVIAYAVFMIADGHQASAQTPCRQGP